MFKNIFDRENSHRTQAKATATVDTTEQKLTDILRYMLMLNEKVDEIKDKVDKTEADISQMKQDIMRMSSILDNATVME